MGGSSRGAESGGGDRRHRAGAPQRRPGEGGRRPDPGGAAAGDQFPLLPLSSEKVRSRPTGPRPRPWHRLTVAALRHLHPRRHADRAPLGRRRAFAGRTGRARPPSCDWRGQQGSWRVTSHTPPVPPLLGWGRSWSAHRPSKPFTPDRTIHALLLLVVAYLLAGAMAPRGARAAPQRSACSWMPACVGALGGGLGIVWFPRKRRRLYANALIGPFGYPNALAGFLLLVGGSAAAALQSDRSRMERGAALVACAASSVGLYFTRSRGVWVAVVSDAWAGRSSSGEREWTPSHGCGMPGRALSPGGAERRRQPRPPSFHPLAWRRGRTDGHVHPVAAIHAAMDLGDDPRSSLAGRGPRSVPRGVDSTISRSRTWAARTHTICMPRSPRSTA